MVVVARNQIGATYELTGWPDIKNPGVSFRCDGLVEYVYEQVGVNGGVGFFTDAEEEQYVEVFYPSALMSRMTRDTNVATPIVKIMDSGSEITSGGVTNGQNISIEATDTESGSGLAGLKIWLGDPDSDGTLIKSIFADYNISHTYLFSELGELPEGHIFVRVYDQAANFASVDFAVNAVRPYARVVEIVDASDALIYKKEWVDGENALTLNTITASALGLNKQYKVNITFAEPVSEPVLVISGINNGENIALASTDPAGQQQIFSGEFTVPDDQAYVGKHNLTIFAKDTANSGTPEIPLGATVLGKDRLLVAAVEGTDKAHQIAVGEDTDKPVIGWYDVGYGQSPQAQENSMDSAEWMVSRYGQNFTIIDPSNNLARFELYKNNLAEQMVTVDFPENTASVEVSPAIPEDGTGYSVKALDSAGNASSFFFHLDRNPPVVSFTSVVVELLNESYLVNTVGKLTDSMSGVGVEVQKFLNPLPGPLPISYTGSPLPPGPSESLFSYSGLYGEPAPAMNQYVFAGKDKANLLGRDELWLINGEDQATVGTGGGGGSWGDWQTFAVQPSGVLLKNAAINVQILQPASGCNFVDYPTGMKVAVKVGQGPEAALKEWDNIPLQLGYTPEAEATILEYEDGNIILNKAENVALPQFAGVQVYERGNTNYGEISCSDGQGGEFRVPYGPESYSYFGDINLDYKYTGIIRPRIVETEWVPAGLNVSVDMAEVSVEVSNISKPGTITLSKAAFDPKVPGYRLADSRNVYDVGITAEYSGPVRIMFKVSKYNLTQEQIEGMRIYHNDNGQWVNVTDSIAEEGVKCVVPHASPFAVMVPVEDALPPITIAEFPASVEVGGIVYVSSSAEIALKAVDSAAKIEEIAGVATTYFLLDADPDQACLLTPYDAQAPAGTCANPVYRTPFRLSEGAHQLYFFSVDNAGNFEPYNVKSIVSDGTPPAVSLKYGQNVLAGSVNLVTGEMFSVAAEDLPSNGVSAGRQSIFYLVDVSPTACSSEEIINTAPAGTCDNPIYSEPFSLPVGAHTVYYSAVDNVGNRAEVKSVSITVTGDVVAVPDIFAPTGSLAVGRYEHAASRLADGKVLVTGGWGDENPTATAELYDPAAGVFSTVGAMSTVRGGHRSVLLGNGKVLVAGGSDGPGYLASAELYDPASKTFSATGSMSAGRYAGMATLLPNGKVLITGGRTTGNVETASAELYDPATGLFTPTGNMNSARCAHFAVLLPNGKVLVGGGVIGSGFVSGAEIYDPATGVFTPTGSLVMSRYHPVTALLPDGRVLVAGGANPGSIAEAELYDPASGTFTQTGSMSDARLHAAAALLGNGKVLVAGGSNGGHFASTELYDPATGKFAPGATMNTARDWATATILADGRVLMAAGSGLRSAEVYGGAAPNPVPVINNINPVTGPAGVPFTISGGNFGVYTSTCARVLFGSTAAAVSNWSNTSMEGVVPPLSAGEYQVRVERIDNSASVLSNTVVFTVEPPVSVQDTFVPTGSLAVGRYEHAASRLADGKVLITGGWGDENPSATAELYDPTAGVFSTAGAMLTGRGGHRSVLLGNGKVLVAGGSDGPGYLASAELYDPVSKTFSATGSMSAGRYAGMATLLPNGKVLITGGRTTGNVETASAELYDPATGVFTPTGNMNSARCAHFAVLLPNGKVLVGGGVIGSGFVSGAEIYDPATGVFTATGSMLVARYHPVTALLPDGRVLVAGGANPGSIAEAELYDPSSGTFTQTGSMSDARLHATATLLGNGKVLVAGGSNGGPFASAELYDPVSGTFTPGADMNEARDWATATLLQGGRLLMAAGSGSRSAELYLSSAPTAPVISAVSPSSGPVGGQFTLTGSGFGAYTAGSRVFVGTAAAVVSSWTGTSIAGKVPAGLSPGEYVVSALAELGGDFVVSSTVSFTVTSTLNSSEDGLVSIATPGVEIEVSAISTETITSTMTVFTAMIDSGLEPVQGAFYEFEPGGVQFAVPATLKFSFDPVGVDTTTLAIYYFDGVNWSSTSVLNQRVVFESDTLAYLEGEITHTSMYAMLRKKTITGPVVTVAISPSTLNLDSNGGYITAELSFAAGTGCFKPETVNISAVGDTLLAAPIYAQKPGSGKKKGGYDVQCGTATVKFDRDAVAAVLPANALVTMTVSGILEGGMTFSAQGAMRTIRHFKAERSNKWHYSHGCGAHMDGKEGSLRDDQDLFMLKVERDLVQKETRKQRAAEGSGFKRRGTVFEFGPEGLRFDTPVTISLPYEAGEKAPERLAVAYWNDQKGEWEPLVSKLDKDGRFIRADVEHFSQYQVVELPVALAASLTSTLPVEDNGGAASQAAIQEFRLGQVYVYPDPAKGGKVPTFHIEVGLADTVEIRVFSVAGKQVHERTLGGSPQFLGGAYAYEYQWAGHIASGVYYYTIEAQRGGRKLRTKGKFAVVR
ncbi:MAG: hypothetical protein A2049_08360 [Elusimicrobia bacterium GWA2_62_23]|nr:MAG: hypothetical protein A2049_08360 [Elusimicrobia bacterium GWA2_62_23]